MMDQDQQPVKAQNLPQIVGISGMHTCGYLWSHVASELLPTLWPTYGFELGGLPCGAKCVKRAVVDWPT